MIRDRQSSSALDPLPVETSAKAALSPAAALFVERARSEGVDVEAGRDAGVVEELCRHLDGIPLAIELAAGRARSVPPLRMLDLLDDRFRLLSRGRRSAGDRHRTLRATVAWSYDLLTPTEQVVFDRLSAFVGPFDIVAATAVTADDEIDRLDVIDAVASLHDKSMCASDAGPEGHRYRLLETLRAFGREDLETRDERNQVRIRHAEHHIAMVEQLRGEVFGPDEHAAALQVERMAAELRAAVERCAERGDDERVRRLLVPLRPFTWRSWYEPSYWTANVESALPRQDWVLDLLLLHAFLELDADRGAKLIEELETRSPDGSTGRATAHVFASLFATSMLGDPIRATRHAALASQHATTSSADPIEQVIGEFAGAVTRARRPEVDRRRRAPRRLQRARR